MALRSFIINWVIAGILILGSGNLSTAEDITFQGLSKTESGDLVTLKGKLTRPEGDRPFPAIVMVHGCRGIVKFNDDWAKRLAKLGYVALQVDHFGPRGIAEACGKPSLVPFSIRTQDAYDAKAFLGKLPFVDRSRIAVMGWSQGGITVLSAVSRTNYDSWGKSIAGDLARREDSFRAAIAFYPYCNGKLDDTNAPLLILMGELDTWCPAALCQANMPKEKAANEVILKIYSGAYHLFDSEGEDSVQMLGGGVKHQRLSNPEALADSIVQVREFLAKHLK